MSELTWLYLLNSCTFLTVGYAITKRKQKRDPLSVSPRGEDGNEKSLSPVVLAKKGSPLAQVQNEKMSDQDLAVWYNDNVIYPDKVRLNCYYYRHYSFIKDIQMIMCTVLGKKMEYAGEVI